jgi:hypothetical protein
LIVYFPRNVMRTVIWSSGLHNDTWRHALADISVNRSDRIRPGVATGCTARLEEDQGPQRGLRVLLKLGGDRRHDMIHRSFGDRLAHVLERSGLAMVGAACGLFVAAYMARTQVEALSAAWLILAVMIVGALGFYLGVDVPPPAKAPGEGEGPDRVEILSAAGTFLAALMTLVSVAVVILDLYPRLFWPAIILLGWLVGAILQIAAGIIARIRA